MRLHHQFELNIENRGEGSQIFAIQPSVVEELVTSLTRKGYTVLKSSAHYMGIPQSITVIKEFTGPFTTLFSSKLKEDFDAISAKLGIDKLFN